jgi:hypothetical protein
MGIMSLGPALRRFSGLVRGTPPGESGLSELCASAAAPWAAAARGSVVSGLTTTMGGAAPFPAGAG